MEYRDSEDNSYSYRVKACNAVGCSEFSEIKTVDVARKPGVPASITVPTTPTDGNFNVSWGTATGTVSRYDLDRQPKEGGYPYQGQDRSYGESGLSIGSYTYNVRACNIVGAYTNCSDWKTSSEVTVAKPASAPQLALPTTSDSGDHKPEWKEVDNTRRYTLQQKIGNGGWFTVQDEDVLFKEYRGSEDNSYSYRVQACNSVGCSEFSGVKTVDVARKPGIPASITVPTTPSDGNFNVSWGTATGTVSRYDLDRQPKDGGYPYQGQARSYGESGLSIGSYTYSARACNIVGAYTNCSDWRTSTEVTVAKPASPPAGFSAPALGENGDYAISWKAVGNTRNYVVEERIGSDNWNALPAVTVLTHPFEDKPEKLYSYRVKACNAVGCSSESNVKAVQVIYTPDVPGEFKLPEAAYGSLVVFWGESADPPTRYELDERIDDGSWARVYSSALNSTNRSGLAVGEYMYRVRACRELGAQSSCSLWRTSPVVIVEENLFDFESEAPAQFSYDLTSTSFLPHLPPSDTVAITQGEGGVMNGAAAYNVSVQLPPAINDLKPDVGLFYNSQAGEGLLGVGWDLSGLSAIERCSASFATEGQQATKSNPRYSQGDRLCLNGNKLVLANGNPTSSDSDYWQAGAEYRTESDRFVKVVAEGSHDTGHRSFTVWTRGGRILTFGGEEENQKSRVYAAGQANGPIKAWALDKVSDRYDNSYSIHYERDTANGEHYPARIDLSPQAAVVFSYRDREGQVPWGYDEGNKYKHTKLLDKITTFVEVSTPSSPESGTPVREYQVDYELSPATARERLTAITECGFDVGARVCAKPLTFGWQDGEFGFQTDEVQSLNYCSGGEVDAMQVIDIDGDGYTDAISKTGDIAWGNTQVCFDRADWISQGIDNIKGATPIMTRGGYALLVKQVNEDVTPHKHSLGIIHSINRSAQTRVFKQLINEQDHIHSPFVVADLNGDGLSDFHIDRQKYIQRNWSVPTFDTSSGLGAQGQVAIVNLDSDGMPDFIRTDIDFTRDAEQDGPIEYYDGSEGDPSEIVKLVGYTSNGGKRFTIAGNESRLWGYAQSSYSAQGYLFGGMHRVLADINGDGFSDFVYHRVTDSTGHWYYRLNTGDQEVGPQVTTGLISAVTATLGGGPSVYNHYSYSFDFDKDGRDDLIAIVPSGDGICKLRVLLSRSINGEHAFEELRDANGSRIYFEGGQMTDGCSPVHSQQLDTLIIGDVNNDGLPDFHYQGRVHFAKTAQPDLMVSITDGLGAETRLEYSTLSGDNHNGKPLYTPDAVAPSFPQVPGDRSLNVVKRMSISNGMNGGFNHQDFYYTGLRHDFQGRGSLGFARVDIRDSSTNIVTTTRYHQSYPLTGREASVEVKAGGSWSNGERINSKWVSRTENSYVVHPDNPNFSYRAERIEQNFELATNLYSPLSVAKTVNTYDAFGNLTGQKTTVGTGISGETVTGVKHTSQIANQVNNNAPDWLLGFIERRVETATDNAGNEKEIITEFEAEPNTLDVRKRWDYVGEPIAKTTTTNRSAAGVATSREIEAQDIGGGIAKRSITWSNFADEIYPETRVNALGHRTTYKYDKRFGVVSQQTDPLTNTTHREYNAFGGLTQETAADGTVTEALSYYCNSGSLSCPQGAAYAIAARVINPALSGYYGAPLSIVYFDSLQREMRKSVYSINGDEIKTDTQYLATGQLRRKSQPYTGFSPSGWTTYSNYDALGRVRTISAPDGGSTTNEFSVEAGQLKTIETITVISPQGSSSYQINQRYTNALGQVVKVIDANETPVTYEFDVFGYLKKTRVNNNDNTDITIIYDVAGNKVELNDPDAGVINYEYNGFGELRRQTWQKDTVNAKSITYSYDKLGRKTSRTDRHADGTGTSYSWVWDTRKIGLLSSKGGNGLIENYYYDSLGRLTSQHTNISGLSTRSFSYTYDAFSRVETVTYPGNLKIQHDYHASGSHARTTNITPGQDPRVIWALGDSSDDSGTLTEQLFGNGVMTRKGYDAASGRLNAIRSGRLGPDNTAHNLHGNIQQLSYQFDTLGNLRKRASNRIDNDGGPIESIEETFRYDSLNRLKSNTVSSYSLFSLSEDYDYDRLGNLTDRGSIGSLVYDRSNGAGVHAVTAANDKVYHYDAYGNMVERGSETLDYDVFNKPTRIGATHFSYGPEHDLFKTVSSQRTTYKYNGGLYEETIENGVTIQKSYVGGYLLYSRTADETTERYLHTDHLGSIEAMTDAAGKLVERMSFGPWGQRRQEDWLPGSPTNDGFDLYLTNKGYTGHDMLDEHQLIHMGGRVYDQAVGRFLSPDLFIQAPHNSQSFNRYSYVMNNPLSYTDPTGYYMSDFDMLHAMAMNRNYAYQWSSVGMFKSDRLREVEDKQAKHQKNSAGNSGGKNKSSDGMLSDGDSDEPELSFEKAGKPKSIDANTLGFDENSSAEEVLEGFMRMNEGDYVTGKSLKKLGGEFKNAKHLGRVTRTENGLSIQLRWTAKAALAVIPNTPSIENGSDLSIARVELANGDQAFHITSSTIRINYSSGVKAPLNVFLNNNGWKESLTDNFYYPIGDGGKWSVP